MALYKSVFDLIDLILIASVRLVLKHISFVLSLDVNDSILLFCCLDIFEHVKIARLLYFRWHSFVNY